MQETTGPAELLPDIKLWELVADVELKAPEEMPKLRAHLKRLHEMKLLLPADMRGAERGTDWVEPIERALRIQAELLEEIQRHFPTLRFDGSPVEVVGHLRGKLEDEQAAHTQTRAALGEVRGEEAGKSETLREMNRLMDEAGVAPGSGPSRVSLIVATRDDAAAAALKATTERDVLAADVSRMRTREADVAQEMARLHNEVETLTAERDRLAVQVRQVVTTCERLGWNGVENPKSLIDYIESAHEDRDTLRERVQALEADLAEKARRWELARGEIRQQRERADGSETRAMAAERRLSAIRQRAEEVRTNLIGAVQAAHGIACGPEALTVAAALVRFVVGEDATGAAVDPMHPNGHCTCAGEGTCEWCSRDRCTGCGREGADLCTTCEAEAKRSQDAAASPDPSTAEAFATVRCGLDGCEHAHGPEYDALSLLERRMGAMGRALKAVRADVDACPCTSHDADAVCRRCEHLAEVVDAALADAPPAFTLDALHQVRLHANGIRAAIDVEMTHHGKPFSWFARGVEAILRHLELIESAVGSVSSKDPLEGAAMAWALQMHRKLQAHASKGGPENWRRDNPWALLARVEEEVSELKAALGAGAPRDAVTGAAANVMNMAGMVADAYTWQGAVTTVGLPKPKQCWECKRRPAISTAGRCGMCAGVPEADHPEASTDERPLATAVADALRMLAEGRPAEAAVELERGLNEAGFPTQDEMHEAGAGMPPGTCGTFRIPDGEVGPAWPRCVCGRFNAPGTANCARCGLAPPLQREDFLRVLGLRLAPMLGYLANRERRHPGEPDEGVVASWKTEGRERALTVGHLRQLAALAPATTQRGQEREEIALAAPQPLAVVILPKCGAAHHESLAVCSRDDGHGGKHHGTHPGAGSPVEW